MTKKGEAQKKGKDFEGLIAMLERVLGGDDVKIERNVKVPEKNGDGPREIDILLHFKKGIYASKVIIECRDRSKMDDTSWIDSLIAKRIAINATHVVAVTSNKFSSTMIRRARREGILLRQIEDIDIAELADWLKVSKIKFTRYISELHHFQIRISGRGPITAEMKDKIMSQAQKAMEEPSKPYFFHPKTKRPTSLEHVWYHSCQINPEMIDEWGKEFASRGTSVLPITLRQPISYILEVADGTGAMIKEVVFRAIIRQDVSEVLPRRALRYREGDDALAHMVSFEKIVDGHTISIDISKTSDRFGVNVAVSPNATVKIEDDWKPIS